LHFPDLFLTTSLLNDVESCDMCSHVTCRHV